uniref:J3 crystallin-like protein n=1 Tax=Chironex fleckeri TaxID=45396 RepID=A0A1W6BTL7_CHIFL|nr:J3 crystallin-like protein [Chironex fleckeri]
MELSWNCLAFAVLLVFSCCDGQEKRSKEQKIMMAKTCQHLCNEFLVFLEAKVTRVMNVMITPEKPEDVITYLNNFCEDRGMVDSLYCTSIREKHRAIFKALQSNNKEHGLCKKIGVCSAIAGGKTKDVNDETMSKKNSCRLCQSILGMIKSSFELFNQTTFVIDAAVKDGCRYLIHNESAKKTCFMVVDQINKLSSLLTKKLLEPEEYCRILGYCTSDIPMTTRCAQQFQDTSPWKIAISVSREFLETAFSQSDKSVSSEKSSGNTFFSAVEKCIEEVKTARKSKKYLSRRARAVTDLQCPECGEITQRFLAQVHLQDLSLTDLGAGMKNICSSVRQPSMSRRCSAVTSFTNTIEKMIEELLTPILCRKPHCSFQFPNNATKNSKRKCLICKAVLESARKEFKYVEATVDMILEQVDNICKHFGTSKIKKECKAVTSILSSVTHFIAKLLSGVKGCRILGFCK